MMYLTKFLLICGVDFVDIGFDRVYYLSGYLAFGERTGRVLLVGVVVLLLLLLSVSAVVVSASLSGGIIEFVGKEWGHDLLKVYIKAPSDLVLQVMLVLNDWSSALEEVSGNSIDNSELGGNVPDGVFDFVFVGSSKEVDIVITVEKGAAAGVLGMTQLSFKIVMEMATLIR